MEQVEKKSLITVGVALGRSTHTVVIPKVTKRKLKKMPFRKFLVAQSEDGAKQICKEKPDRIIFVGNRQWGTALAYFLLEQGFEVRYVSKKTEKGSRGENFGKYIKYVLQAGVIGRPFSQEKKPRVTTNGNEEIHSWYTRALEYHRAANEVRRARHRVLSSLSVLFPEAVRPSSAEVKKGQPIPQPVPPGIWTKGMAGVLQNPDPFFLAGDMTAPSEIRELAQKSLARSIPQDMRRHAMLLHKENLESLAMYIEQKEESLWRLKELVGDHQMVKDFGESDSAIMVAALLGWRMWPHWKELRAFCGLAVTRVDSKGKPRISRVRGEIRQYLYLLATRATLGKELAGDKKSHVKRIERLLKTLRLRYFKPEEEKLDEVSMMDGEQETEDALGKPAY